MAQSLAIGTGTAYPASITAAALQTVWDLRLGSAGLNGPLLHTPAGDTALLTSLGGTIGGAANQYVFLDNTAHDFSDWDFSGYELDIDYTQTRVFTNCKLNFGLSTNGPTACKIASNAGSPTTTFTHCEITNPLNTAANESAIVLSTAGAGAARTDFNYCYFHGAKNNYVSAYAGSGSFYRCWFQSPGIGATGGDSGQHLEAVHHGVGTWTYSECLLNFLDGLGLVDSNFTSMIYVEAWIGTLSVSVDRCVFVGAAEIGHTLMSNGLQYGGNQALTYTISNSVVEKATSIYWGDVGGSGSHTFTQTNNRDYVTAAIIP